MKKILITLMIMILLPVLTACAQPLSGEVVQSQKQRVSSPQVEQSDLATLAAGNTAFAFNLYQALKGLSGNVFYSPYSISAALAMTYAGARGETEQQMEQTLQFLLSQEKLHPAFNALDQELASRGQGAKGKDEKGFRLNIVNAIWGQKDFSFLPEFLDRLVQNYGAGLRILDFMQAPEESRLKINKWVEEQTEERIKDLIPQGSIDALTRLVLTNAIYFNAAWKYPFDGAATQEGHFYLLNGGQVSVSMMHQSEMFGYAWGDGFQVVELPYDGDELSMVILLPQQECFTAFEAGLNSKKINEILEVMEYRQVALSMPQFEFESEFSLKDYLSEMGMPLAFTESADFSGMTGQRDLYISEVIHKAFVSVDEAGTEAAAATAVIMKLTAMPAEPVEIILDHPFIFFIRDIETGAVLFIGRVLDPSTDGQN